MHAHLKRQRRLADAATTISPNFGHGATAAPAAVTALHLQVPMPTMAWNKALAAGAEVRFPARQPILGRPSTVSLADPFGFTWSIGAPVTARG